MVTFVLLLGACVNPFAPALEEKNPEDLLGDQTTVEGLFQNWRYAYIFKDTVVYGNLLADNFTFIYRNYDQGVDYTWTRDEDMIATYRLFQGTQSLDLIWNEAVVSIGDTINRDISRGFTLSVMFSADDIIRVQGRANLKLIRSNKFADWQIVQWRDESNF